MKKIIPILVCICFLCINASAYYDVNDYALENKIETLSNYNIINGYDDGSFKPNNLITRAEFCKIMIDTILADAAENSQNSFADVSDNHWAREYICISKGLGIISGVSDTLFAPDDNVTYEQAIKMIVAALGYNEEAVEMGGYPNGYIDQANLLGIMSGLSYNKTDYATRGDIATMIYNALNIDYYSIWNENGTIKRMSTEKTLLEIHEDLLNINTVFDYDDVSNEDNAVG